MIAARTIGRTALALLVLVAGLALARTADAKSMHMDVQAKAKPCGRGCTITVTLRNGGDHTATVSVLPQARRAAVNDRRAAIQGTLAGSVRLGQVTLGQTTETHSFDLNYGGELTKGTPFAIVTGWGASHVWGGVTGAGSPADGTLP